MPRKILKTKVKEIMSIVIGILPSIIIILIVFSLILIPEIKRQDCYEECYNNSEMLRYALESEHGINHVCFDKCEGGS